jgi:hypothetical protein
MKITRTSGLTGAINTRDLDITPAQYTQYLSGTLAQLAFPHLSADDREFLITGITPEEWREHIDFLEEC